MSTPKKKRIVTTTSRRNKPAPTTSRRSAARETVDDTLLNKRGDDTLIFGRENFWWMFLGVGLIVLGMFLMGGGAQPSPEVWDDNIIYSFRRVTLAPILILAGVVVEVYAIFK